jgi:putative FmdB family regulatory protein
MPTYEYRCEKCKKHFEIFQKISEAPLTKCPECQGQIKRLVSAASFTLKGGGWYKDGYASQGPASSAKKSAKKETKSDK